MIRLFLCQLKAGLSQCGRTGMGIEFHWSGTGVHKKLGVTFIFLGA